MDLEAYLREHPDQRPFLAPLDHPKAPVLRRGVFRFTPETAHNWGGPFPGDVAGWTLSDMRLNRTGCPARPYDEVREEALRELRAVPKPDKVVRWFLGRIEAGDVDAVHEYTLVATDALPFRLRVHGNDDASWSKWLASREDADALIELFEAGEPLDFDRDFRPFGFAFTN